MSDNQNPFNIINNQVNTEQGSNEIILGQLTKALNEHIVELLGQSPIILFMKGTRDFPQCGFSANSIAILNHLGAEYKTFDILKNPEIRQGLKDYSNWPTYPQLYVNSKLVGGNDIITELFESGELKKILTAS